MFSSVFASPSPVLNINEFAFWGSNWFIVDWLGRYLFGHLDQFSYWSFILVNPSTSFIHTASYELWSSNGLNWLIEDVSSRKLVSFKKKRLKSFYVDFNGILLIGMIISLLIMMLQVQLVDLAQRIFCSILWISPCGILAWGLFSFYSH